jgi:hypothetical protein
MAVIPTLSGSVYSLKSRVLVITPCSAGKRHPPGPRAALLNRSSQSAVEAEWLALLEGASAAGRADSMYRGRAFGFAVQSASIIGGDLGIISAGLGYVTGQCEIPSYDLTLRARIDGSVRDRVTGSFEPTAWWRAMQGGRFSSSLSADVSGRPLVLLCLSRNYATMVGDELMEIARSEHNIRIFGLNISPALPRDLVKFVLPYDERLTSIGAMGTRVDFPQRALLHYVSAIHQTASSLDEDLDRVRRSLAGVARQAARVQRREGDDSIKVRIKALIPKLGAGQAKILQHLRHVENVSCEQGRFSKLFAAVQDELGGRY